MKSTNELNNEAQYDLEREKEEIAKEVIKEHLQRLENAERGIEEATERCKEAKMKYDELLKDKNLLLKLCLQKASTQPK